MAVTNCVVKVLEADNNSIILLDEPEVSLHPGAQTELRNLLLNKVNSSGCQVVISTHSHSFVEALPNNAIKLFYKNKADNTYSVLNESTPEQAFLRIGIKNSNKITVFVEDKLAKLVVEEALKEIDSRALSNFTICQSPGGAKNIIKHHSLDFYLHKNQTAFVLLDGDEMPKVEPIKSDSISKAQENSIDSIIKEHTNICGSLFNLPIEKSKATKDSPKVKEQEMNMKKGILDAFNDHFKFMNIDTPEELIWNISEHPQVNDEKYLMYSDYKSKFKNVAEEMLAASDSEIIYSVQKAALIKRNINHPLWVSFKEDIIKHFSITVQQD